MNKVKSVGIFLILATFLAGGTIVTNAQNRPPLLRAPSGPGYGQAPPPPPPGGRSPLPPGQRIAPAQPEAASHARKAVAAVLNAKPYFAAGKVWLMTGPHVETELKAAIVYEGTAVAVLHFNPADGSLLPLGMPSMVLGAAPAIDKIKRELPGIVDKLEVVRGAEYRGPENSWIVPLVFEEMIVARVKVSGDGVCIVPDYPANQEMKAYQ